MSSINSVSASTDAFPTAPTKPSKEARADFKALAEALKDGDVKAAQTAFASLKKDDPNLAQKLSEQDSSSSQKNPMSDLAAALDKGDLTAAQTAMASLKKGHHGHHRGQVKTDDTPTTTSTTATADSAATSTTGTVIDVKV